ncbi:MAG: hypothetical protein LC779_03665 [Actinobacteria bacterium]|nr:hypothetical protein [Actinomycetota bacterium]
MSVQLLEGDSVLVSFEVQSAAALHRLVGGDRPGSLRLLLAGLDGLAALTLAELSADAAVEVAAALLTAQDRLQALAVQAVAEVETRQLYRLAGSGSTGSWMDQQHASMPPAHVALARKLDRVPQLTARIAEGGISVDGAVDVARALDRLRPHLDRPDGLIDRQPAEQALAGVIGDGVRQLVAEGYGGVADTDPRLVRLRARLGELVVAPLPELARLEGAFLLLAEHLEPRLLRRALAVLVDALLPHQLAERSEDAHLHRGLELTRDPERSGWLLRGTLDDECGERLHTALTAAMATDPHNPTDTAARVPEDEVADEPPRRRSVTQRRHDGLNLLLGKLLGSTSLGSRGKARSSRTTPSRTASTRSRPSPTPSCSARSPTTTSTSAARPSASKTAACSTTPAGSTPPDSAAVCAGQAIRPVHSRRGGGWLDDADRLAAADHEPRLRVVISDHLVGFH